MKRLLLILSLVLAAGSIGPVLADDIVREGTHFACRKVCYVTAIDCAKANPTKQFCGTRRQDCEERCDVAATGPATPIAVVRPSPSPYDLCTQRCGMARHSCIEGGNGEAVCESGSRPCESRCAKQYGVTLPGPKTPQVSWR